MKHLFVVTLVFLTGLCWSQRVGDLVVTPTRLSLDDKLKSGSITVVNRSNRTVRYRLNLVDMEMSNEGILKRITGPVQNSAINVLRLSPREIVLEPGSSQRVRILATLSTIQGSGELRSHLSFEPINKREDKGASEDIGLLKVSLETRALISIPVIVNYGNVSATTKIFDAKVEKIQSSWRAEFKLARDGNRTIRGDINILFKPENGGKTVPLGQIASLPVYFPNDFRLVRLPIKTDLSTLGKGEIEFKFGEVERGRTGASTRFLLPFSG